MIKLGLKQLLNGCSVIAIAILIVACNGDSKFQRTESGLKYVIHTNNDGPNPKVGDIMYIQASYRTDYDSVLYNSSDIQDSIAVGLTEPTYQGGFEDGFKLLSAGDSATFYLLADSVFKHTFKMQLPDYIKSGSGIYLDVKLKSFESRTELDARQKAELDVKLQAEQINIDTYLSENNIIEQASSTGLYFIKKSAGNGSKAENGDMITMTYTGKFFDGKVFDTSVGKPQAFKFTLGTGQVIPGWDEAVARMRVGDKAFLVIPSQLAYGPRGYPGLIPPFTPLTFDVELVAVEKN